MPDQPRLHWLLGQCAIRQDDAETAIVHLREVLKAEPTNRTAYLALGTASLKTLNFGQAAAAFGQAHRLQPQDEHALKGLVQALKDDARFEEAMACLTSFLREHDGYTDLLAELARIALLAGDNAQAMTCANRAIELEPHNAAALNVLSQAHLVLGNFARSAEVNHRILEIAPRDPEAVARKFRRAGEVDESDIRLLQDMIADAAIDAASAHLPAFALGRVLDRKGRHEQAFAAFRAANDRQRAYFESRGRKGWGHSPAQRFENWSRDMERVLDKALPTVEGKTAPIFILGMPRSGTTLTEQIISAHSSVHAGGEIPLLQKALAGWSDPHADWARIAKQVSDYRAYLDREAQGARLMTDKLPGNYASIGLIRRMMPDARIVLCRRPALDICWSIYTNIFNADHLYATDLQELGEQHRYFERVIAYWREKHEYAFLELDYRNLVEQTQRSVTSLAAFLDLDPEPAMFTPEKNDRPVQTLSLEQVRRPIYTGAVERWKPYERMLKPLIDALEVKE